MLQGETKVHREQDEDFEVVEVLLAAIGVREFNHQVLSNR